ncbi:MAG: A/G-specific adenine glycosylase [Acidobacteriota bacterium]|nr:A/G-specific adenine glycosylase [Acidobacteriota bacterium]
MEKLELPVPVAAFCRDLLRWYQRHRRDLPWRRRLEPYPVLLAEVMLQQTQVKTVVPYYRRFLKRYPTLEDLAESDEDEVLALWSGLGYYSRARNLRRAAQQIRDRHGGEFPRTYQEMIRLPGVGRYTAGAVLSIAYGQPLPILDGNIRRLFARYLKMDGVSAGDDSPPLWDLLTRISRYAAAREEVSDLNQALMELGALVCTPRSPGCGRCPLEGSCLGLRAGVQEKLPLPRARRAVRRLSYAVAVIRHRDRFLLARNREGEFLKGMWEFPRIRVRDPDPDLTADALEKAFHRKLGLSLNIGGLLKPVRHQITFRRLTLHPVVGALRTAAPPPGLVWADPGGDRSYPVPAYVGKIARLYAREHGPA